MILEFGSADLGALQIGQDTERFFLLTTYFADHLDECQLLLVGAMGEVQANHIDAGTNQVPEDGLGVGGGPKSSYNFRAALGWDFVRAKFCVGHQVAPKKVQMGNRF